MSAKIIVEIVVIALAAVMLISLAAFWMSIKPPKWPVTNSPSDFGMAYEPVHFPSSDDITLSGWWVPATNDSDKTIVMMHGYPAAKSDILPLGVFLHSDFNILFFDFRYMGESQGKYTTAGALEVNDLLGALQFLQNKKAEQSQKIGLWGFSLGGAVGLMSLDKTNAVQAVVADSSYATLHDMIEHLYSRYGILKTPFVIGTKVWTRLILGIKISDIAPEESVKKTNTPIMLIHGTADKEIAVQNSQRIYENIKGSRELWLVEGAEHGQAYFKAQSEYERRVIDFFNKM
ncbi:prolyl oligopeptidase family serine peptidase [Patescibacteria group bacterium]|nr:prolyl oligopeptidase family serine peptidase [Patescibacteria group bacterium]